MVLVSVVLGGILLGSPVASADTWTETSEADFLGGTLTNANATPSGDVVLAGSGGPVAVKQGMVLDVGPGAYDSVSAYNPSVLRESDGSCKMWYTAYDGSRFRLAFADSPDGITWTKRGVVINVLTAPWNFDSVTFMSVIKEGATYHGWFAAGFWSGGPGPGGFWSQVYYATSADGMSWSISGAVLGLGSLGSWDDSTIAAPWVVYDGSLYRLYYIGWDGTTNRHGLATSATKTGFTRYAGNPILDIGPSGSWDDVALGAESVMIGAPWTMYYGGSDGTTMRLGLAYSSDGYVWTKYSGNPWMLPGPAAWDSNGIAGGAPVSDPAGDRLYYSGGDGTHWRIGYALLSSGGFSPSGSYVSRVFDSGGTGTTWQTIAWSATTPAGTAVDPFVRAGDTPAPDPSWTSWAAITGPPSGTPLSLPRSRYVQYRMYLSTTDPSATPALHDVTITYGPNGAPTASPTSPSGGAWVQTQTPALQWTVSDPEGDPQAAFEVQVSPDPAFANYLSSGIRSSLSQTWQPPVLAEGVWHWRVRVADPFGLWGGWGTASFGIDITPPVTSVVLGGPSGSAGWYVGPVSVTLTASDATSGVSSISYRVDGGAWQTYISPFFVPSDGLHVVDFHATDVAGVTEPTRTSSFRIDATPPTTSASLTGALGQNGWYTSPVTVSLRATDATSGVASTEYRVDGTAWATYVGPFIVSGEGSHIVVFRSSDIAGNAEPTRSSGVKIDSQAPASTISLTGTMGANGWYTSPVTASLTATDATSGVSETQYRIDGGPWQTYGAPFVVAADGQHVVGFRSIDNANLTETVQSVSFKIDTTPPVTMAALSARLGDDGFYTAPVTVILTATDATSGVASTEYRLDGGAWQPYGGPFLVSGDGSHTVAYRSTDRAGLTEADRSIAFDIDTVPPETTAALSGTAGLAGYFTGSVTVNLTATDATSGISETRYRVDGGPWLAYSVPFEVSGDGTHRVEFLSVDNANLTETVQSVSFKIDTTPPVTMAALSARLGDDGFYTAPVTVTLTAADATSGVASTEYRVDGGGWQPYSAPVLVEGDGSHTVAYRSTDRAGLVEAEKSIAIDIDTVPPGTAAALSGPAGVAGFFTGSVTVSLTATDATSGVSETQYRVDGGAWQTYSVPFVVTADGLHVVEFYSTDNAGLEEPVQVARFSVDTGILSPTGPFGPWLLVALIAIAAAVVALLIGFALWRRKRKEEPEPPPATPPESPTP